MTTRIEFDLETAAPPEAVRSALIDFSDRRPELWPGLPRECYEVYEVGDTWAEVKEGYRGPIWVREHYDWSTPGRVEWRAVACGFASAKRVVAEIAPDGHGGSRVHVTWEATGKGAFGRWFVPLMGLTRGFFIRRSVRMGLDLLAPSD